MANELKFGDVVVIPNRLHRTVEQRREGSWKVWEVKPYPKPRTGILIGFRTLSNGTVWYGGDDGTDYTPKDFLKAALVALDPKTKPVLVRLEDVANGIVMPQAQA